MTILKIARMGNPVLNKIAAPIKDPLSPEIQQLANDMRETLLDIGANGLAAPQVHVSKRLIVYRIAPHQIPSGVNMMPIDWRYLINPVIIPLTDEKDTIWERCLSVPGLHGMVPRYKSIKLVATQLDGSEIEIKAHGFHAMLLQHEVDHLDGIVYPMRMEKMNTLSFNSELGDKGFFIPRSASEFAES